MSEIISSRGEPLSSCATGAQRLLQGTGVRPDLARRLAALGLRRGAQVTLLMRTAGGGGIVSVAGSRIALDHSMLKSLYTIDLRDAA
ncbi:MAG: ferrous iron transport protein A [Acidipropionibacterium sp.]|jgi:ferrous iron transport protein A|nr:ferrous iron transport protein A [Acidipropionibacterium sp.]